MRTRRFLTSALLVLTLAGVSAAPASAGPARGKALAYINELRAQHGVAPLRLARSLNRSANAYARRMQQRNYYGHASRIQASAAFRILGEVIHIHAGRKPLPRYIVRGWRRSPAHNRVLVDPRFHYIGIGKSFGRMGRWRATAWVAHLGKR